MGFAELSAKVIEDKGEEKGVIEEELAGRQRNKVEDEQVSSSVVKVMPLSLIGFCKSVCNHVILCR